MISIIYWRLLSLGLISCGDTHFADVSSNIGVKPETVYALGVPEQAQRIGSIGLMDLSCTAFHIGDYFELFFSLKNNSISFIALSLIGSSS